MLLKLGPFILATRKEWEWFRSRVANEKIVVRVECEDLASEKLEEIHRKMRMMGVA